MTDTMSPITIPLKSHLSVEEPLPVKMGTESIKKAAIEVTYGQGIKNFIARIAMMISTYMDNGTRYLDSRKLVIIRKSRNTFSGKPKNT